MKWKRNLALVGTFLLVLGVAFLWSLGNGRREASRLDRNADPHGPVVGEPAGCGQLVEPEVTLARRVMALQETQAVTVVLASASVETCQVTVTLNAPNFDLSPPDPRQLVAVGPGQRAEIAWILSPEEVGTFDLILTIGGAITILGVTVTNALGLTAGQLQILSALSTILGPMLTVPWWFEQWQKWRAQKRERQEAQKERPAVPFE